MGKKAFIYGAGLAVASALASTSFAAGIIVAQQTYSGTDAEWAASWGNGTAPSYTNEIVGGARRFAVDTSPVRQDSWGTWMGGVTGAWIDIANQPHSSSLADYTVASDVKIVGSHNAGGYTKAVVTVQFFTLDDVNPDGTPFAVPDADTESQMIGEFKHSLGNLSENVWTTREYSLADFVSVTWNHDNNDSTPEIDRYTWDDTVAALGAGVLGGVNFSYRFDDGNSRTNWGESNPALYQFDNAGGFGLDAGNEIWFDNSVVSVVPEPSVLAGLGVASLALIRRRRSM